MDPVAIAAYMVQSQTLSAQGDLGVALMKQSQETNNQVLTLLSSASSAAASYAPAGTGQILNVVA